MLECPVTNTAAGPIVTPFPQRATRRIRRKETLTVLTALILASVVGLLATVVVVLVASLARGTVDPAATSPAFGTDPGSILLSSLPLELALAVTAFLMVSRSKQGPRAELGLVRPALRPKEWLLLLAGSGTPFAGAMILASLAPSMTDKSNFLALWKNMSPMWAVLWVVAIGAMPGLAEEIFFRGFAQRRLARSWSPVTAIVITSVLFALLHVDPATMVLAVVMGLWLGFVAWRTGSTWPGIAIHALINSGWNAGQIWFRQTEPNPRPVYVALIVLGVISVVCFVWSVGLMMKRTPPVHQAGADADCDQVAVTVEMPRRRTASAL